MDGKLGKNKQTRFFSKIFSFFLPLYKTINRFLTNQVYFRSRTGLCRIASCLAFNTDHTVYHAGYFHLDISKNIQVFFAYELSCLNAIIFSLQKRVICHSANKFFFLFYTETLWKVGSPSLSTLNGKKQIRWLNVEIR